MTIEEFLRARFSDDAIKLAARARQDPELDQIISRLLSAQRLIVDWHQNWPVLMQGEPKLEGPQEFESLPASINQLTFRMTQKLEWITREEYTKRFGDAPPTAPLLRQMAAKYSWHPDYNTDWEI